jgi:Fe-S-cluster containining protein
LIGVGENNLKREHSMLHSQCIALTNIYNPELAMLNQCKNIVEDGKNVCGLHFNNARCGYINNVSDYGVEVAREQIRKNACSMYNFNVNVREHRIMELERQICLLEDSLRMYNYLKTSDDQSIECPRMTNKEYILESIWDLRGDIALLRAKNMY